MFRWIAQRAAQRREAAERAAAEEEARIARVRRLNAEAEEKARHLRLKREQLLRDGLAHRVTGNEIVVCGNGHRYRYDEFHIDTQYLQTEYHWEQAVTEGPDGVQHYRDYQVPEQYTATESKWGCPLCKTSVCKFEDPKLQRMVRCKTCQHYSVRIRGAECMYCNPDQPTESYVSAYPGPDEDDE